MFKTRITETLGIKYPIVQGAMLRASLAELAAAVSNAGGLGIIASAVFASAKELRDEIRKAKTLTDKPFGVNINLFPATRSIPNEEFIDTLIEEGVRVVETSGVRSPEPYIGRLKKGNVKVIHKATTVRHAVHGEQVGADMIAAIGFEQGGNMGMDDVTTFVLVPRVVDSVKVPVLAGGGIADGRGFVAALALGAEGVVIGTRFLATHECNVHPKYKDWLLRSTERDTVVVQRSIQNTHRVLKNEASRKVQELEARGAPLEEFFTVIKGEMGRKVMEEGELNAGMALCGLNVGLIHEVVGVKEFIESIVNQAQDIGERLHSLGVFTLSR
jgi:NAD(P)H-dependent flavin oxidoreductase YrpB (nitropropane dioxygenase family)